jgi:hypothetical protein
MSSNRIPLSGPHPAPNSLLLPKPKLVPISLVPWNPSSTPSTSKRPSTSSYNPTADGRCHRGGNGSSAYDGSSSNGYDAWTNGSSRLYACSYGSWAYVVWRRDHGWTWTWGVSGLGTTATDVSGANAASTSEPTSTSATPSTPSTPFTAPSTTSSPSCPTTPQQTTHVGRTYSSRNLLCAASILTTPLYTTRFETISLLSSTTSSRTKWIWTKAW